jgi:starch-binding outer membrane protein, SusD/RagB family
MTHLSFRRAFAARTAVGATAILLAAPACSVFDTNVTNPNAIEESALGDPASAPTLANGLNSAVTRMITSVYGPYSVASDELTWVGSRENWGLLDNGDVSDPLNEYNDAAYPFASEARWLSNYTIDRLEGFDKAGQLRSKLDLARTYVYAAVTYITIGDNYDDFVLASDRTKPAAPVGEANMLQMYDSAVVYLDRGLVIAKSANNTDLQSQILGLRARAKFSMAVWRLLKPARTTPANPLVNDAGANADATAALAVMASGYRYRIIATTANTGTNNVGSEMNSRQEIRAGGDYINPDPARSNLQPLLGVAGIKLKDPVSGVADPVINKAIDECCRVSATTLIPFTLTSWKEMQLILAEASLASGNTTDFRTRINAVRALDQLPAWDGTTPPAREMLIHERRVNLFLQTRRLHDLYRFGLKADRWLPTSVAARKACFFPITAIERQSNPLAPQPTSARSPSCT